MRCVTAREATRQRFVALAKISLLRYSCHHCCYLSYGAGQTDMAETASVSRRPPLAFRVGVTGARALAPDIADRLREGDLLPVNAVSEVRVAI